MLFLAADKAKMAVSDIEYVFSGDLLNQCVGSSFALRDSGVPFFGLFGACSTMAEALSLAAIFIDGGFCSCAAAITSSHFCSAERQFRQPLEYGGQRPPTSQWTVTGAGALILKSEGPGPYVTHITTGKIVDAGVKDANNMGAAMAPAAYDTLKAHFEDTGRKPGDYDAIVTGDLGSVGREIFWTFSPRTGLIWTSTWTAACSYLTPKFGRARRRQRLRLFRLGARRPSLTGMREGRWKRILLPPPAHSCPQSRPSRARAYQHLPRRGTGHGQGC